MGYRAYGEPKCTKANPLTEFCDGFIWGFIGFPYAIGWILPALGIASWLTVGMIGTVVGTWTGGNLARSAIRLRESQMRSVKT